MTTLRMSMNHTLRHMLACEGCGQAKSNWDNARKADFVVTSVRAVHDLSHGHLVMDMLCSAPNSASARCTVWTLASGFQAII